MSTAKAPAAPSARKCEKSKSNTQKYLFDKGGHNFTGKRSSVSDV